MEAGATTDSSSIASNEETDRWPSLNTLALMRKATTPADISSIAIEHWHRVKFWVDEKLHRNCFLVLPKACEITWGYKGSCSSWITEKENCFRSAVDIHVFKLKKLSWLFIQGRFRTIALSPYTTYEVAFVVKLIGTDDEWQHPVELELGLPDGTKETSMADLKLKPKEEWINLRAGEFIMDPGTVGTIHFALYETFDPEKSGLILRGVTIHPKD
ncbi:hypothetical protein BT93_J1971 [Corymbia citriodora subsp. variegata]|nr:hypothetical protein BT93_J1971 [Corymbia citriodora subsp. variegata]